MIINHRTGIEGAATARGAVIVIDVFRAFSAAAFAFSDGAQRIVLAEEVEEARTVASTIPDSVLMGESNGVRPEGFHLGNSPGEIVAEPSLVAGRTIVHRSSAGTRCARAALSAGAAPLYVASLVVAEATAAAVGGLPEVTIVAAGLRGTEPAVEDEACARLIADILLGGAADGAAVADAVAGSARATTLRSASFAHPDDVRLCCEVDRFGFAMQVATEEGLVVVRPTADPRI